MTEALPYGFARRHGVLVQPAAGEGGARCLFRTGASPEAMLEVQRRFGAGLAFEPVAEEAFESAVAAAYRDSAGGTMDLADTDDLATLADSAAAVDDLLDSRDDSPVIRLINALLLQAVRDGASDIHVETQEKRLIVRFRIDGVLRDVVEPKRALAPLLVSRIKVMARLDIAEKRVPQDGRVTLRVGGYDIDVRVSTIPTQHGERVVMRLLDRGSTGLDTAALGLSERDRELFIGLLDRPHGILLVTGPTGSGKTTTLYTALTHLNDRKRNIMTVEDPIEYELAGVAQTQVNARTGMTFARGLRAILRQDPDVIMVGEVRDAETAHIAIHAALTGHLVLTTLHTETAAAAVPRLIDLGIEGFLLKSTLRAVVAQRLVRVLCDRCKVPHLLGQDDLAAYPRFAVIGFKCGEVVHQAGGCERCGGTGYRGRNGVFEILEMSDEVRALIGPQTDSHAIDAAAMRGGMTTMLEDAVAKCRAGLTTVPEVFRVTTVR